MSTVSPIAAAALSAFVKGWPPRSAPGLPRRALPPAGTCRFARQV